jgi:hypothetical protein
MLLDLKIYLDLGCTHDSWKSFYGVRRYSLHSKYFEYFNADDIGIEMSGIFTI